MGLGSLKSFGRNRVTMSTRGTSRTARTKWTPTSTSTKGTSPAATRTTRCPRGRGGDDETFGRIFPRAPPPKLPVKEVCPVSHKIAVYRDPVTDIPYSNIRSFKIIREAYKKYITAHGLPSAGASATLAAGSPMPDPGIRPTRQKIIIKQSVPAP
ncbi:Vacuolar protein sorting-associated protein 72-like protein, partial [Ophiophagus hannah]